ncbi:MAG: hypothetical protein ABIF40_03305 [archaeon]
MKKNVIIGILLVFTLIFGTVSIAAEDLDETDFNVQLSYDWLASKSIEGNYEDDVFTTAWATLALEAVGYSANAESSVEWILTEMSETQTCFPSADCEVKDTVLAMMALESLNDDTYTEDIEAWLKDAQNDATVSGEWLLEISTSDNATCIFSYELNNQTSEVEVSVEAGEFPDCGGSTFFDLKECLVTNLVTNNPSLDLSIDCADLSGDVMLTHLYRSSNSYYIIESVYGTVHDFLLNTGCFGRGAGDTCNKESSFYANWALSKILSEYNTLIYLKENIDTTSIMDNAFLYMFTGDDLYANNLLERQRSDGSFERDIEDTAFAVLALKNTEYNIEVSDAIAWLEEQQNPDGSWNEDVLTTAIVLYSAFDTEYVVPGSCYDGAQNQDERGVDCGGVCEEIDACCSNGIQDEGEEDIDTSDYCSGLGDIIICDEDGVCDELQGEDVDNCPSDCEEKVSCYNGIKDGNEEGTDCGGSCLVDCCIVDGTCDVANGEDGSNCLADCNLYCGDGYCQKNEDCAADRCYIDEDDIKDSTEPGPKEEGSNSWLWILLILILVGLFGAAGYVAYSQGYLDAVIAKFSGGKPQTGNSTKSAYTPYTSKLGSKKPAAKQPTYQAPARPITRDRSDLDKQLDKSIGEAKKLLGKK